MFASGEPDAFALTGIGARSGGMGNAAIGLADEIETVYYNPAGLGNLTDSGVTAMYQAPELSTSRGFVGFNARLDRLKLPGEHRFRMVAPEFIRYRVDQRQRAGSGQRHAYR